MEDRKIASTSLPSHFPVHYFLVALLGAHHHLRLHFVRSHDQPYDAGSHRPAAAGRSASGRICPIKLRIPAKARRHFGASGAGGVDAGWIVFLLSNHPEPQAPSSRRWHRIVHPKLN